MKFRQFVLAVVAAAVTTLPALGEDTKPLPMINGEVTKVDESAGKLTIKHEAIGNLDMDAMTMVFKAADPMMLKDMKPGEKIKFSADKVNGQLTVTKIEKGK